MLQVRVPWYYNDKAKMRQVGGFVKKFEQITLITIRVSIYGKLSMVHDRLPPTLTSISLPPPTHTPITENTYGPAQEVMVFITYMQKMSHGV